MKSTATLSAGGVSDEEWPPPDLAEGISVDEALQLRVGEFGRGQQLFYCLVRPPAALSSSQILAAFPISAAACPNPRDCPQRSAPHAAAKQSCAPGGAAAPEPLAWVSLALIAWSPTPSLALNLSNLCIETAQTQLAWFVSAMQTLVMVFTGLDPVALRWFSCDPGSSYEACNAILASDSAPWADFCKLPSGSHSWTRR